MGSTWPKTRATKDPEGTTRGPFFPFFKWTKVGVLENLQTIQVQQFLTWCNIQIITWKHWVFSPNVHPFKDCCFNWMISNLYLGNGCCTKTSMSRRLFGVLGCHVRFFLEQLGVFPLCLSQDRLRDGKIVIQRVGKNVSKARGGTRLENRERWSHGG